MALEALGYAVDAGLLTATSVGAAQERRRHVLLASLEPSVQPDVSSIPNDFGRMARTLWDAIRDLGVAGTSAFDTPATHRPVNVARIAYLFANDLYELPDHERPDCHRLKPHSYRSVYGRMHSDRPAPTITSGFGSTGQGRFVHPFEQRTLTPHEAARVQGFPDWFSFAAAPGRRSLQEMIGNAVPSQLAYAAIASLLR
jgi:DNA (cytosine-5)-methyltransferase 1